MAMYGNGYAPQQYYPNNYMQPQIDRLNYLQNQQQYQNQMNNGYIPQPQVQTQQQAIPTPNMGYAWVKRIKEQITDLSTTLSSRR